MADTGSRRLNMLSKTVGRATTVLPRHERSFKPGSRRDDALARTTASLSSAHSAKRSSLSPSFRRAPYPLSSAFVHPQHLSSWPTEDAAKGLMCLKKKSIPGLLRMAAVGNQVWCVTETCLRVLAHNARDIKVFENNDYAFVVGAGGKVFVATRSGSIDVYSTQTVTCISRLSGHKGPINALCVSPAGVWSAGVDGTVRLWELESLTNKRVLHVPVQLLEIHCLVAVNQYEVWAGAENGSIYVFDPTVSDDPREVIKAHDEAVHCLCRNGNNVWSGSDDHTIAVWDIHSKSEVKRLERHHSRVSVLTSAGSRIFSGSFDCKIALWDPTRYEVVGNLPGNFCTPIFDIAAVGLYLWAAAKDDVISVYLVQDVVDVAQGDLNKYCLRSVNELSQLLASTVSENEQHLVSLRTLFTQLMRCEAWYAKQGKPTFLDDRSGEKVLSIPLLSERLGELDKRWDVVRSRVLDTWEWPSMTNEIQGTLRGIFALKAELAELKALFYEYEDLLTKEFKSVQTDLNATVSDLTAATKALSELEKTKIDVGVGGESRLAQLKQEVATSAAKSTTLQQQVDDTARELSALATQISSLTEGSKQLEKKAAEAAQQTKVMEDEKHRLALDNETKARDVQFLSDQLGQKNAEIAQEKAEIGKINPVSMAAELKAKQERLTLAERQLRDAKTGNTTLSTQSASLKKRAKELEEEDKKSCCLIM
eukprot:gnl/Hemi2/8781_TR3043_c0_g1_i2.p1 gnl/Hemi2/8781_TR3043_c0_g1~~gnl/Hemi2/8781_TR3043_c0_g1_i2.p1  ORF type:complete len:707 (+),score=216.15 gnl/Hemi2/8781_TR3043_c0_g1_i2:52-2172(+)